MEANRRILMVTSVFPRREGDAKPPFVQNLCELMVDAGGQVTVLAPHAKRATFRENVNGVDAGRSSISGRSACSFSPQLSDKVFHCSCGFPFRGNLTKSPAKA